MSPNAPSALKSNIGKFSFNFSKLERNLRIQWIFQDKPDKRSDLEKQFYQKSDWEPPPACLEIENMISRIQENFDKWSPLSTLRIISQKVKGTF